MEDLIGLLIFLIIFGSRIAGLIGKFSGKTESGQPQQPPMPPQRPVPQQKRPATLADWLEEAEKRMYPKEEPKPIDPASVAPGTKVSPTPPVRTTFPVHPPQPERTGVTDTTLREPSRTAKALIGPGDLQRAIIMKEVLGPPRSRQKRGPSR